jgi:hypothetical protein
MRLSPGQIAAINVAARRRFGADAVVSFFGSRVDDKRRGGDIVLYIETTLPGAEEVVRAEIASLADIKRRIGEQKIDVLVDYPARKVRLRIFEVARQSGVRL